MWVDHNNGYVRLLMSSNVNTNVTTDICTFNSSYEVTAVKHCNADFYCGCMSWAKPLIFYFQTRPPLNDCCR